MGRIEDCPRLVADAGLCLAEVSDVTGHTRFTFSRMLDGVSRCRQEFERTHGTTVEEVFAAMEPAHPDVPVAGGTPGIGCLIVLAHKPGGVCLARPAVLSPGRRMGRCPPRTLPGAPG